MVKRLVLMIAVLTLFFASGPFLGGIAAAQEVKISYSDWQLAQDIWGRSLREAIADFEKQNPGIKVETEPVALGQRDVKFTTEIRAGKSPDVFA